MSKYILTNGNLEYSGEQMEVIRQGLEDGLDVSVYADPKYNAKEILLSESS